MLPIVMTISIRTPEDHNVELVDARVRFVSVERGNLVVFPDRPVDRACFLKAGAVDQGEYLSMLFPLDSIGEFTVYQ
ncbi:MAG: hypothetical protein NVS3B25_25130 [Hymenobacter sp.]